MKYRSYPCNFGVLSFLMCRQNFKTYELQRRRIHSVEKELDSTPMSVLTRHWISKKKQEISYLIQQMHQLRFERTALKCKGALAELVQN